MEEQIISVETEENAENVEQVVIYENQTIDYNEQFQTIIELQTQNNQLIAQNNVNQLFAIGTLSALLVIMVMYNFLKKFI